MASRLAPRRLGGGLLWPDAARANGSGKTRRGFPCHGNGGSVARLGASSADQLGGERRGQRQRQFAIAPSRCLASHGGGGAGARAHAGATGPGLVGGHASRMGGAGKRATGGAHLAAIASRVGAAGLSIAPCPRRRLVGSFIGASGDGGRRQSTLRGSRGVCSACGWQQRALAQPSRPSLGRCAHQPFGGAGHPGGATARGAMDRTTRCATASSANRGPHRRGHRGLCPLFGQSVSKPERSRVVGLERQRSVGPDPGARRTHAMCSCCGPWQRAMADWSTATPPR